MTIQQEAIYTALKIDNDAQNVTHLALWRERWLMHCIAADILFQHFGNLGDTNGRT